jgi:hypothetical protein
MAVAVTLLLADVLRGRVRVTLVLWLAAVTLVTLNVLDSTAGERDVVLWQVLLVAGALALALRPLITELHHVERLGVATST